MLLVFQSSQQIDFAIKIQFNAFLSITLEGRQGCTLFQRANTTGCLRRCAVQPTSASGYFLGPIVALNIWLLSQAFRYFEHHHCADSGCDSSFLLNYRFSFYASRITRAQAVIIVLLVSLTL